ncbi:hypothetical protein EVAR_59125_1 [Eumeta japonica]|uniref:Uncharacterized protein n=1 Tax=Eumeta variegata TaxID=151549 RepID=A0A4C1ZJZ0_EUMVA|nr:hypothetical protein EVAR_59125_1 [Eumeta japonica]
MRLQYEGVLPGRSDKVVRNRYWKQDEEQNRKSRPDEDGIKNGTMVGIECGNKIRTKSMFGIGIRNSAEPVSVGSSACAFGASGGLLGERVTVFLASHAASAAPRRGAIACRPRARPARPRAVVARSRLSRCVFYHEARYHVARGRLGGHYLFLTSAARRPLVVSARVGGPIEDPILDELVGELLSLVKLYLLRVACRSRPPTRSKPARGCKETYAVNHDSDSESTLDSDSASLLISITVSV